MSDDAQTGMFLPVVFPGVELQPAFDKHRAAFAQEFICDLSQTGPERDVNKSGFFVFAILFVGPHSVDGQAERSDWGSFWTVAKLDFASEVTDQKYFIERWHRFLGLIL